MTAAAAALLQEPDALDAHAAVHRFHHVIDREAGNRDGGERLHLDSGWSGDFDARGDGNPRQPGINNKIDFDLRDGKGMTEWNQFVGAFGRHDAGNSRGAEHVAFFRVTLAHNVERRRLHHDAALCDRFTRGYGFTRNIHHAGFAARAEMAELRPPRHVRSPRRSERIAAGEQRARGRGDIALAHQALADQKCRNADIG